MECSSDFNCSAFRYSPKNGFGFKCKNSYPSKEGMSYGYEKNDWTLCNFESGKNMKIVDVDIFISLASSLEVGGIPLSCISFDFLRIRGCTNVEDCLYKL